MTDTPFVPWPENPPLSVWVAAGDHHGLNWCVQRRSWGDNSLMGPSCTGYVQLPADHPWLKIDFPTESHEVIDVHGGITFGPEGGWIGFDYRHFCDDWEGDGEGRKAMYVLHAVPCTQQMVEDECLRLAEQAAEVTELQRSFERP